MKIGILGAGGFAANLVPIFQAHPDVDEVALAELIPERRARQAASFGIEQTYESLDQLCDSDVDAIAIFTQRWLHAPQAIQALRAGKHVFSAVPAAITLEEMSELVEAVEATRLTYMLGETSYYYPAAIYCRRRFARGDFGDFVYAEGEYLHDMSHGFYDAYRHRGGPDWKRTASFPPMLYPSHSVAIVLSVTGARMTQVSCLGYEDREGDGVFEPETSLWRNSYSNETALFRISDGGMCRINEFRRIGISGGSSVRISIYGTRGSFEEQANARTWNTLDPDGAIDLRDTLRCVSRLSHRAMQPGRSNDFEEEGVSSVHPVERLPAEFVGLPNGHHGSHQFLVLDFIEACRSGSLPTVSVWDAARYCVPGMVAHESALLGGSLLPVPDLGGPPGR